MPTHPPCSQMIHGSVLFTAGAVNEPFCPTFSHAQKKSVSLGCPALFTGIFPAKLRGRGPVMLGSLSVTSKSGSGINLQSDTSTSMGTYKLASQY